MAQILTNGLSQDKLAKLERKVDAIMDILGSQIVEKPQQAEMPKAIVPQATGFVIQPTFADVVAKASGVVATPVVVPNPELRIANTREMALEYVSHLKPQGWRMTDEKGNPIVDANGKQRFSCKRHFIKTLVDEAFKSGQPVPIRADGVLSYTPKTGKNAGKLTEYNLICKVTHANQNGYLIPQFEYGFQPVKKI